MKKTEYYYRMLHPELLHLGWESTFGEEGSKHFAHSRAAYLAYVEFFVGKKNMPLLWFITEREQPPRDVEENSYTLTTSKRIGGRYVPKTNVMYVNIDLPADQQKFALYHEIAHWTQVKELDLPPTKFLEGLLERHADVFAREQLEKEKKGYIQRQPPILWGCGW